MKKTLFLTLCCVLTIVALQAQTQKKSKLVIKASIGVLPTYLKDKPKTLVPPLSLGLDYKVQKKISLEAYVAYSRSQIRKPGLVINTRAIEPMLEWENNFTVIGLKTAIHTTGLRQWDFYGGMMVNFNITKIDIISGDAVYMEENLGIKTSSSKISFSGFVGGMYLPTEKIGLFSELGFGISLLSAGVSYRL